MTEPRALATDTYALTSTNVRMHLDGAAADLPQRLLGSGKVVATSRTPAPVFLGVALRRDADA